MERASSDAALAGPLRAAAGSKRGAHYIPNNSRSSTGMTPSRKTAVMAVAIVIGIIVVAWISADYRDEVKAFLRALLRAI